MSTYDVLDEATNAAVPAEIVQALLDEAAGRSQWRQPDLQMRQRGGEKAWWMGQWWRPELGAAAVAGGLVRPRLAGWRGSATWEATRSSVTDPDLWSTGAAGAPAGAVAVCWKGAWS